MGSCNTNAVAPDPLDAKAELTQILVVSDANRSRAFWTDVLGADRYREYGTSVVLRFAGSRLLLVAGGDPTPDKPTVTFVPPVDPDLVSHSITLRIQDCRARHTKLSGDVERSSSPLHTTGAERFAAFFATQTGTLLS